MIQQAARNEKHLQEDDCALDWMRSQTNVSNSEPNLNLPDDEGYEYNSPQ